MKTSPQLETSPVKDLVQPGMRWRKNYIALSLPAGSQSGYSA
jgi:hypothetical protein